MSTELEQDFIKMDDFQAFQSLVVLWLDLH